MLTSEKKDVSVVAEPTTVEVYVIVHPPLTVKSGKSYELDADPIPYVCDAV